MDPNMILLQTDVQKLKDGFVAVWHRVDELRTSLDATIDFLWYLPLGLSVAVGILFFLFLSLFSRIATLRKGMVSAMQTERYDRIKSPPKWEEGP